MGKLPTCYGLVAKKSVTSWQQVCVVREATRPDTTDTTNFCHFWSCHGSSDATTSVRLLTNQIAAKTWHYLLRHIYHNHHHH